MLNIVRLTDHGIKSTSDMRDHDVCMIPEAPNRFQAILANFI
jgi:hypothetical protein